MVVFNDFIQLNVAMFERSVEVFFLFGTMTGLVLFFLILFGVFGGFGVGVCFGIVLMVNLDNIFNFLSGKTLIFVLHIEVYLYVYVVAIGRL